LKTCVTCHYDPKCFEAKEKERKEKEVSKTSLLSSMIFNQQTKHKRITLHLAKNFGTTNIPVNLVDNAKFQEFI